MDIQAPHALVDCFHNFAYHAVTPFPDETGGSQHYHFGEQCNYELRRAYLDIFLDRLVYSERVIGSANNTVPFIDQIAS
jgi:hypothetical protein